MIDQLKDTDVYYVYIYLDPRTPGKYQYDEYIFDYEPFYVGKGKDSRMYAHLTEAKDVNNLNNQSHKLNKIRKILSNNKEPIILKIKENLPEICSFNLEIKLISVIGRSDLKKGPLTNLTDGGEGFSGLDNSGEKNPMFGKSVYSRWVINYGIDIADQKLKEFKDYRSIQSSGENNGMFGKKASKETKEKQSSKKQGIYNGSKNPRARKIYQYDSELNFIKIWDFGKETCDYYNFSRSNFSSICKFNTESMNNTFKMLNDFIFLFEEKDEKSFICVHNYFNKFKTVFNKKFRNKK